MLKKLGNDIIVRECNTVKCKHLDTHAQTRERCKRFIYEKEQMHVLFMARYLALSTHTKTRLYAIHSPPLSPCD